jgi:2',3'-cyclic-nucleotide 2'-phosphodiesterase (5'-nucleotidase family)
VTITDLTIERTEKDGKVSIAWEPAFRIVDTKNIEPDPEIAALVKTYTDKLDQELGIEIGSTETPLDSRRATVRSGEAAIGNLIADAMRDATGAGVAITNGGGIRGDREYPAAAKLTRKDILTELPFGNKTVKLELAGSQLREAIENGLSQVETGAGRFPQISGMTMAVDLDKPAGERVVEIMIGGAALDPAKTYIVATNDFMARGGDGYDALAKGRQLINAIDATLMASQVIDYIAAKGTVAPQVEGRIVMR